MQDINVGQTTSPQSSLRENDARRVSSQLPVFHPMHVHVVSDDATAEFSSRKLYPQGFTTALPEFPPVDVHVDQMTLPLVSLRENDTCVSQMMPLNSSTVRVVTVSSQILRIYETTHLHDVHGVKVRVAESQLPAQKLVVSDQLRVLGNLEDLSGSLSQPPFILCTVRFAHCSQRHSQ